MRQKLLLAPGQHQCYQQQISERGEGADPTFQGGGGGAVKPGPVQLYSGECMITAEMLAVSFEEWKGNQMITKASRKLARCNWMYSTHKKNCQNSSFALQSNFIPYAVQCGFFLLFSECEVR